MRLNYRLAMLPLALAFGFSASAYADSVYGLNATLTNGDTISGTISFQSVDIPVYFPNTSTLDYYQPGYEIDGGTLTLEDGSTVIDTFSTVAVGSTLNQPYMGLFLDATYQGFFEIEIPGEIPLQGSPVGAICSLDNPCSTYNAQTGVSGTGGVSSYGGTVDVVSGAITTPEPSSMVLLGSGLLGLALIAFRRTKAGQPLTIQL